MRVIAIADLYGLSGRRAELDAALAAAEDAARGEPGCLRYSFARTLADPEQVVLIGEWRDEAALDAHYRSPAFAAFQASLYGLLARPSEMTVHTVDRAARPLASLPLDPRDAD